MIIVFLISNSTCSLLVCRKAVDFFLCVNLVSRSRAIYIVYSAYCFQEAFFILLSFFLLILSDCLHRQLCHLQTKSFICSFPVSLISFSCFIALARTSNTILKRSDEKSCLLCTWSSRKAVIFLHYVWC